MEKKEKVRNIGVPGIKSPADVCSDCYCPFHGTLGVRGRIFQGTVIKKKTAKSAIVEWNTGIFNQKYERFEKKRSRIKVHTPECLHIHPNDTVIVGECRPISKTKSFVVLKKVEAKQ
ncbi:MAG TPA: 30S ribosomal protein S17 [Candidatus Woesearchaeota archaeon]|nr:30S ribosomal protein S17 [Candidatus Woesearchaeota archaeon]